MKRILALFVLMAGLLTAVFVTAVQADCDASTTGNDTIVCDSDAPAPSGSTNVNGQAGNDSITTNNGTTVGEITGEEGNDTITVNGTGSDLVLGDSTSATVTGNDSITINGTVNSPVIGDGVSAFGNGGDDTITVNGTVNGDMYGDYARNGGDDSLTVSGTLNGNIYGDGASSLGGDDTITVTGTVNGSINGDYARNGGNDSLTISGTVNGDVYGDRIVGFDSLIGGDDAFALLDGAVITGTIYGGAGADTLTFNFLVSASDYEALAAIIADNASFGTIEINGSTYTWDGFEALVNLLRFVAEEAEAEESGSALVLDDRLNFMDIGAPVAVYCGTPGMVKVVLHSGQELYNVSFVDALAQAQAGAAEIVPGFWALPGNQLQVTAAEVNEPTKLYTFTFDAALCLN